MTTERRNTSKEKAKDNRGFPYNNRWMKWRERKYKVVDSEGNSYGEFMYRSNALKEIKRQEKQFFRFDLMLEYL